MPADKKHIRPGPSGPGFSFISFRGRNVKVLCLSIVREPKTVIKSKNQHIKKVSDRYEYPSQKGRRGKRYEISGAR